MSSTHNVNFNKDLPADELLAAKTSICNALWLVNPVALASSVSLEVIDKLEDSDNNFRKFQQSGILDVEFTNGISASLSWNSNDRINSVALFVEYITIEFEDKSFVIQMGKHPFDLFKEAVNDGEMTISSGMINFSVDYLVNSITRLNDLIDHNTGLVKDGEWIGSQTPIDFIIDQAFEFTNIENDW